LNAKVDQIVVFNVGQGNGIIMRTSKAHWIVDFGSDQNPTNLVEGSQGQDVEDELKEARKLISEDLPIIIVITHPHTDHYNRIQQFFDKIQKKIEKIEFVIISHQYDISKAHLSGFNDAFMEAISKKKYFLSTELINKQNPLDAEAEPQNIFFVNNPAMTGNENHNSLILHVRMKEGEKELKFLLTGDATMHTLAQIKYSYDKGDKVKFEETNQWKLLTDVDYYVAPHHGSNKQNSHMIIEAVQPRIGVIFSSPLYSKHHHPTCQAVVKTAEILNKSPKKDEPKAEANSLIYCDASSDPATLKIDENTMTPLNLNLRLSYAYSIEIPLNAQSLKSLDPDSETSDCSQIQKYKQKQEAEPDTNVKLDIQATIDSYLNRKLGNIIAFYPSKPSFHLLSTHLQIFVTGVSGRIMCTIGGCKTQSPLAEPEPDKDFLKAMMSKTPFNIPNQKVYTEFSIEKLCENYKELVKKPREDNPSSSLSGRDRSSARLKNAIPREKIEESLGIWTLLSARKSMI